MSQIIHKEGHKVILIGLLAYLVCYFIIAHLTGYNSYFIYCFGLTGLFLFFFLLLFFRNPIRKPNATNDFVIAPADGRVVAIEEVFEKEYLEKDCIKISIFMSIFNVHVNRYPVSGLIKYTKYHPGKYYIASLPKSSELNEHNSTVIETPNGIKILINQIAGTIARRVVCYATEGEQAIQGKDLGFIRFGSRVDIFLPIGTELLVKLNDKVKGNCTSIAHLKIE